MIKALFTLLKPLIGILLIAMGSSHFQTILASERGDREPINKTADYWGQNKRKAVPKIAKRKNQYFLVKYLPKKVVLLIIGAVIIVAIYLGYTGKYKKITGYGGRPEDGDKKKEQNKKEEETKKQTSNNNNQNDKKEQPIKEMGNDTTKDEKKKEKKDEQETKDSIKDQSETEHETKDGNQKEKKEELKKQEQAKQDEEARNRLKKAKKDEEERERLEQAKKDEKKRKRLEQVKKDEEARNRLEQAKKDEEERKRLEQAKKDEEVRNRLKKAKKDEEERKRLEQAKKDEKKRKRLEQENKDEEDRKKQQEEERKRLEQAKKDEKKRKRLEQENKDEEDRKKQQEEERKRLEQEKKQDEEERKRLEEEQKKHEKKKLEQQKKEEEERKKEAENMKDDIIKQGREKDLYKRVKICAYNQFSVPAIMKDRNTFQRKFNLKENNNGDVPKIEFSIDSKNLGEITISHDGRREKIENKLFNPNPKKPIYFIDVENKKIKVLRKSEKSNKKIQIKTNLSDAGIANTKYILHLSEVDPVDGKSSIVGVDYTYYLRGNGVCTYAAGYFLKQAIQNKNRFKQFFEEVKLEYVLGEGLFLYHNHDAKNAKSGEASSINDMLEQLDLQIDPSLRLDDLILYYSLQIQAKKELDISNILKQQINGKEWAIGLINPAAESWGIIYDQGIWYIYDSHGQSQVSSNQSFLAEFSSTKNVKDFIWEASDLKAREGNDEEIKDAYASYIDFFWLAS